MTPTALQLGLLVCEDCALLSRRPARPGQARCPRCGAPVHPRRPDSLARTWALLSAAIVLYFPANLLPIMETSSLFGSQSDTILSGIAFLWDSGSWSIAVVVFVASVLVPIAKMLALALLALSVQARWRWRPRERTRLYRMIELVGRWSMLDIYVVTVLVALVQVSALASIHAGPGTIAFGAVVVLTMFASMAFDPRLIWDTTESGRNG
jgi:paraquat-inducible protein A